MKLEKISLFFRKKLLTNKSITLLIVVVLFAAFIAINLFTKSLDLPEIDVTENKIYTLSNASKELISKIDEDVKIYLFGIGEGSALEDFVKQYTNANSHITYEFLTKESNPAKFQEFELQDGYSIIIIEAGTSHKIIDASTELFTYDYTVGQRVDLTEQKLTNSILGITADQKPKIYFLTGHNEYTLNEIGTINAYLANESYEVATLDLIKTGKVPEDCNILVLLNPATDLTESEAKAIKDYINLGKNVILTTDINPEKGTSENANIQSILDIYGVTIENKGCIIEQDENRMAAGNPYIITPKMSDTYSITSDLASDGGILFMPYAGRLKFKSDEELEKMSVLKTNILTSSEKSKYISDFSNQKAIDSATAEENVISAVLNKTFKPGSETEEEISSKLFVIADTVFMTDLKVQGLSDVLPAVYIRNNKDLMLNGVAALSNNEDIITIRKDMSSSTYAPTKVQNTIVLVIIFAVPVLIILIGVCVGIYRKRKR